MKIKSKFKKLPKPAKVKTVATKVTYKDFLESEYKSKKISEEQIQDAKELIKIFEAITKKKCVMWGKIFGFGTWHYISEKTGRNGLWPATAFAIRTTGIVVYTMLGHKNYPDLLLKLGKFKDAGKSCLQIKSLDDIDTKVLKKLIKQSLTDLKKKYKVE